MPLLLGAKWSHSFIDDDIVSTYFQEEVLYTLNTYINDISFHINGFFIGGKQMRIILQRLCLDWGQGWQCWTRQGRGTCSPGLRNCPEICRYIHPFKKKWLIRKERKICNFTKWLPVVISPTSMREHWRCLVNRRSLKRPRMSTTATATTTAEGWWSAPALSCFLPW